MKLNRWFSTRAALLSSVSAVMFDAPIWFSAELQMSTTDAILIPYEKRGQPKLPPRRLVDDVKHRHSDRAGASGAAHGHCDGLAVLIRIDLLAIQQRERGSNVHDLCRG